LGYQGRLWEGLWLLLLLVFLCFLGSCRYNLWSFLFHFRGRRGLLRYWWDLLGLHLFLWLVWCWFYLFYLYFMVFWLSNGDLAIWWDALR
jgi:hypothetical protein